MLRPCTIYCPVTADRGCGRLAPIHRSARFREVALATRRHRAVRVGGGDRHGIVCFMRLMCFMCFGRSRPVG